MAEVKAELMEHLISQYELPLHGLHGAGHWARVHLNGMLLCAQNRARANVVAHFAVLHDCRRAHEGADPEHGMRAARHIEIIRGMIDLCDEDLELLKQACATHNVPGAQSADITVLTCWDADRLDLGRVGVMQSRLGLSTEAAREPGLMSEAYKRGCRRQTMDKILKSWGALPLDE